MRRQEKESNLRIGIQISKKSMIRYATRATCMMESSLKDSLRDSGVIRLTRKHKGRILQIKSVEESGLYWYMLATGTTAEQAEKELEVLFENTPTYEERISPLSERCYALEVFINVPEENKEALIQVLKQHKDYKVGKLLINPPYDHLYRKFWGKFIGMDELSKPGLIRYKKIKNHTACMYRRCGKPVKYWFLPIVFHEKCPGWICHKLAGIALRPRCEEHSYEVAFQLYAISQLQRKLNPPPLYNNCKPNVFRATKGNLNFTRFRKAHAVEELAMALVELWGDKLPSEFIRGEDLKEVLLKCHTKKAKKVFQPYTRVLFHKEALWGEFSPHKKELEELVDKLFKGHWRSSHHEQRQKAREKLKAKMKKLGCGP